MGLGTWPGVGSVLRPSTALDVLALAAEPALGPSRTRGSPGVGRLAPPTSFAARDPKSEARVPARRTRRGRRSRPSTRPRPT